MRGALFVLVAIIAASSWLHSTKSQIKTLPHIIIITANGFTPTTLTVPQGSTITFVNKDSQKHWPASAVHPTHTVYPGSDKKKCGTLEQSKIFDACRGLAQGEEFSFTFNEKGSWNYHDHLTGFKGIIIVN